MQHDTTEYELRENQPLRLEKAHQGVIECLSGKVWLTAYGQASDILLRPGSRYTIPNQGLILVEAIGSGRIRFHPAAQARQPWHRHPSPLIGGIA
ncbi:DUF2917 domain-containing protein [Janthinobacterium agaricidamnosum]|uniref:DUF2917 domain-containing protein n=1 Tax=Janthinobacterium agaricidamnosum NBRC 102515 = DSM 9628 TaxID=1349767 RepID=W0V2I0_9BURK|nr:DUF2917 domain-containing protein [Janthinobacterium agaricidamnosum]CDG82086.1 putative uncharacterized protein [Janthinobacterium agaricidamnosum NBRC 102515 = DSM 9628]